MILRRPLPRQILLAVCGEWRVPREEIFARTKGDVTEARYAAAYLAVHVYGYRIHQVSLLIDRGMWTVMHALRYGARHVRMDPAFKARLDRVQQILAAYCAQPLPVVQKGDALTLIKIPRPPAYPHDDCIGEIRKLKKRGWSLKGLCRRFELPQEIVAPIIDVVLWR